MSLFDQFLSLVTRAVSTTLVNLILLSVTPGLVRAHSGHGNEFQGGSQAPTAATESVAVDAATIKRLRLKVEPVRRQRLAFGIKITGQIETLPNQQVEVTTPVGGTILRLFVNPGDSVKAGQAVARMTSPELAELRTTALDRKAEAIAAVQQAEADSRLAQQNWVQQRRIVAAEIQQARTEVNFAQERYDKDQVLLARGAIARRQFLESESKLAEARSALAKAESGLPVSEAQAQLRRAQSALAVARSRVQLSDRTYQTRLQQLKASPNPDGTLTLTAPISGTVADRETTVGESGQDAGKKVMTIVNGRSVQVSGNLYEPDLERIQVGQSVRVRANGLPDRSFSGRIRVIGAAVTGETRVIPIKAELANPDGRLKPGMFVTLEVLTEQTPAAVLAIPKSAVVETNNKKSLVYVQNGNAFEATQVALGRASANLVEVKSGVFDGDSVVTQGAPMLYAQSLRGEPREKLPSNGETVRSSPPTLIPWWAMLPVGGAIAVGTFFAGTYWANRRYQKALVILRNEHLENTNPVNLTDYETYAPSTLQPSKSDSDRSP